MKNVGIAERLREAREALGLSQQALAEKLGGTKRSVINWEGGAALPGAEVLARYAAIGADVLYILTGSRHPSAPAPVYAVSEGDRVMLDNFHAAPPEVRAGVKATLGVFAPGGAAVKRGRGRAA